MFHQIHKGLRALLHETALKLQRTDFWHLEEAEDCIEIIEELVELFDKHAHSEDNFIFSAVEKYEPAIADAFEKEHVQDHLLSKRLIGSIQAYRNAPVINEKIVASKSIHVDYIKFMVFNLEHMGKEEEVLNPLLWRYYSDKELHGITQQIISSIPPGLLQRYNAWMMRGLNNAEITGWLKEVEKHAPEEIFQSLFVTAEKELEPRRFRQVLECLSEGAMLA
jgi:hypothetical protein